MWKWWFLGFITVLAVSIFIWQREEIVGWVRDEQVRGLIYAEGARETEFPGSGEIKEARDADYFIEPSGVGAPFFLERSADIDKYMDGTYKVVEMLAQDQLIYAVGQVKGWEDIAGSPDKYLVLDSGKYRIGFAVSSLYGYDLEEVTMLMVEDVTERIDLAQNTVHNLKTPRLSDIGYDKMRKIVRKGDSVVLIPVFAPPAWSRKDDQGNYVIYQMIVRRAGGVERVEVS